MRPSSRRILTSAIAALAIASISTAFAEDLISNGSFEIVGPDGPSTTHTGISALGQSAAEDWFVFHNTEGTTRTTLFPSTLPDGGDRMMHVLTTGWGNGLEQVMLPIDTGPGCVISSVWVFVVRGQIFIGAGNGGNTGPNAYSSTVGEWELIEGENIVCPANLFIIYADDPDGAEFYVDLASVETQVCIGPPGDLNMDGVVNAADLAILLGAWGPCAGCDADLTGDGVVNAADLAFLLGNWGCE